MSDVYELHINNPEYRSLYSFSFTHNRITYHILRNATGMNIIQYGACSYTFNTDVIIIDMQASPYADIAYRHLYVNIKRVHDSFYIQPTRLPDYSYTKPPTIYIRDISKSECRYMQVLDTIGYLIQNSHSIWGVQLSYGKQSDWPVLSRIIHHAITCYMQDPPIAITDNIKIYPAYNLVLHITSYANGSALLCSMCAAIANKPRCAAVYIINSSHNDVSGIIQCICLSCIIYGLPVYYRYTSDRKYGLSRKEFNKIYKKCLWIISTAAVYITM